MRPSFIANPFRGTGLESATGHVPETPSADPKSVELLLDLCPRHSVTALRDVPDLARVLGVQSVHVKDESSRMGLGSFKALGAAYVIAAIAARGHHGGGAFDWGSALVGKTFVTASAGNHGLSVAAGARVFGAKAVIYLSQQVPEAFAVRLRGMGADVVRAGETYEASMDAAEAAAGSNGWVLLSDSSWPGYHELPKLVMQGYLQIAVEVVAQMETPPTHIFVQAGVGGLAAALAVYFRKSWGDAPKYVVVEPVAAPALLGSIRAGHNTMSEGPVSNMGRLDCKSASEIALAGLARDADSFVSVTDAEASHAVAQMKAAGLFTTPSGAAGLAACNVHSKAIGLGPDSRVLLFMSEGLEDA